MKAISASAEAAAVQRIHGARKPVRLLALVEQQLQGAQPNGHHAKAEIVDGSLKGAAKVGRIFNEQVGHEEGQQAHR
jgi:hypothetical protein